MTIEEVKNIFKSVNIDSFEEVSSFYKSKKKEMEENYSKLVEAYNYLCEKNNKNKQRNREKQVPSFENMKNVKLVNFIKKFNF